MAQVQKINMLFEEREKQIIEEASQFAKEIARKELALIEFELFYEVMVLKESKEKAEKSLQRLHQEKWKKALAQSKGNEEEALFIYDAS